MNLSKNVIVENHSDPRFVHKESGGKIHGTFLALDSELFDEKPDFCGLPGSLLS